MRIFRLDYATVLGRVMLATAALGTAATAPAGAQTFTRITDASNPIVADTGPDATKYFGASWIDFDGDGDDDLEFDQRNLYRNEGGGVFVKILGSGFGEGGIANPTFSASGNTWADADNDGDLDVYQSGELSFLYEQTAGEFTRISSGDIGDSLGARGWASAWCDYDNDGAVDLVVTHPAGFIGGEPLPNHLFHNDGTPNYTFTRIVSGPIVTGLDAYTVATWADYDDDGDQDLFIGSGTANGVLHPDNLYRNLLTESGIADFERITDAPIATDNQDGQVWNWIDYDNDGDLDAYLTNYGGAFGGMTNRLYRQEANGSFTSVTDAGDIVTDVSISLGSVWGDFDNDGDLDCFVATDTSARDHYYTNDGDGTFTEDNTSALRGTFTPSRSASASDYDEDGDLDLYVLAPGVNDALFRNDNANGNHWLELDLVGTTANRSAIGAKVRVKAVISGTPRWLRRDVQAQNQFNGQNSLRVHFGLGNATSVDSLVVEWPGGNTEVVRHVFADQRIRLVEGSASAVGDGATAAPIRLVLVGPNPTRDEVRFHVEANDRSATRITIVDVNGRRVRELRVGGGASPRGGALVWDGRDDFGRVLGSGVYGYRVLGGGITFEGRVVLVR